MVLEEHLLYTNLRNLGQMINMEKYADRRDNSLAAIRVLGSVILMLILYIFYQNYSINVARENIEITIPPDLSLGATIKPSNMELTAVNDFATRIFQSIHHWKYNGFEEYKKNIKTYTPFITPNYRQFMLDDFQRRKEAGELNNRTRSMQPLLAAWDVEKIKVHSMSNGVAISWLVYIDMELVETYDGDEIKHLYLSYPLKVVRSDIDRNSNPWGMALDGYFGKPKELKLEDNL